MESARITKFRNLNYEQQQKILFHGSITNNIDYVKDVLENVKELDPRIKNEAFLYAGTKEMIELFIENNVNVNFQDNLGLTALMNAIEKDKIDIVRFLIKECNNIDVDLQNENGQTALMYAISKKK